VIYKIQSILQNNYTINVIDLPLETTFSSLQTQDQYFDSLNCLDFLLQVEKEFNIQFPPELQIKTIGQLLDEINKRIVK
jgi:acyl carrier protein